MAYKMTKSDRLPQRNEYVVGGYDIQHIIINFHEDGTVVRTINGEDEFYATWEDFNVACERNYQSYLKSLSRREDALAFKIFRIFVFFWDKFWIIAPARRRN